MELTREEQEYYARAFREELDRANRYEQHIKERAAQSFWPVFMEMVNRVAPHLRDRMQEIWEAIFIRWMREEE